jgi:hypothetical protein
MFHPCRGGVRGGKDQFSWDEVKKDKDREYYLGHSLMAPVGKWQEGKDLHWYAKDGGDKKKEMQDEFSRAKELEEEALMAALGYKVVKKEKQPAPSSQSIVKSEPSSHSEHRIRVKKEKDADEPEARVASIQRPKFIDTSSKKSIDNFLLALLAKHDRDEIILALGGELASHKSSSSKKKSKKSSKKTDSESSGTENESSSDENDKKSKKRKTSPDSRSKTRKHKKRHASSNSETD